MSPALILAALGVGGLVLGVALLASIGPRFRLGRLLAATLTVSIGEAIALASGPPVYVRVSGRISSTEEFPDEQDRPLVFRRTRIETADAHGRWLSALDESEAVPFGIETRDEFIAIDETAVGTGLVAIPRESLGTMADLPAGLLPDERIDARTHGSSTPARLVIEQLSAVEHATVCGRPVLRDGKPTLSSGTGRPLIVTTLDIPSAMRLLAAGHRRRVIGAAAGLVVGLALMGAAVIALVAGA